MCAIAWKGVQSRQGNSLEKTERTGSVGTVEKELMNGRVAEEMTEERKEVRSARRAATPTVTVTGTTAALETKGKGKSETRCCYVCGEQGHIGVNCPYKWTNSIDEEEDQGSSWESEPEGEKAE